MAASVDPPSGVSPVVDVVIPAQRAGAPLRDQLEALARQEAAPPFRVTVVVAGSDDEGRSIVDEFGARLDLLAIEAPMTGAAAARNAGARVGTTPVILFCDADDRVGPAWVRRMIEALEGADLVGGPIVVDRIGTPRWVLPYYTVFETHTLQQFWGRIPFVISASLGVRRSMFEAVGGFDETFPGAGGEEVELCLRLDRPIGIVADPEASLVYSPRTTFRSVLRQRTGYARGAARLTAKHGITSVGTVDSIEWSLVLRELRSPRRTLVSAASFVALRREQSRIRREESGARRLESGSW